AGGGGGDGEDHHFVRGGEGDGHALALVVDAEVGGLREAADHGVEAVAADDHEARVVPARDEYAAVAEHGDTVESAGPGGDGVRVRLGHPRVDVVPQEGSHYVVPAYAIPGDAVGALQRDARA